MLDFSNVAPVSAHRSKNNIEPHARSYRIFIARSAKRDVAISWKRNAAHVPAPTRLLAAAHRRGDLTEGDTIAAYTTNSERPPAQALRRTHCHSGASVGKIPFGTNGTMHIRAGLLASGGSPPA